MQENRNSSEFPDSLKCPITYELFHDPVIGSDGHTYERENITAWIRKHATSPITREPMNLSSLRPNYIVKKMVEDFLSSSIQKQYQFRLDVDICKAKQRPMFQSPGKTIYEAKWLLKHGPPIVLIKIDGAKAKREASFYVKLSCHPHIVRTYGLVDSNSSDSIMLVQEYAPEGDLSELLRSNNFRPTMEVLLEIFWQTVDAMICLADNKIIHGDLACRNVLVFRSSSNQPSKILVKLTDFGLTRTSSLFSVIDAPPSSTMTMIPIRSAAPEILLNASSSSYSEKSDVYSFGVLMWEACSNGAMPYADLRATDVVHHERLKGKLLERPNHCSEELWNIILHCTQHDSHERPNFKDVREALLLLRFQYKRASMNKSLSIDTTYENLKSRTIPTNSTSDNIHRRSHSEEQSFLNNHYKNPTQSPLYKNLDNNSIDSTFSDSTNQDTLPADYYTFCEYCSQSINDTDSDMHKDVCSVRCLARKFARMVAQLPLLELTSCQYCEDLIPLNMLNIHQDKCNKNPIYPHNRFQNSQQSSTNKCTTLAYLTPVSPSQSQMDESTKTSHEMIQNRTSAYSKQSETSSQLSDGHGSTKPSKTGFRKFFLKFKNKMSS